MVRLLLLVSAVLVATVAVTTAQVFERVDNGLFVHDGVAIDVERRLFREADGLAVELFVKNRSERTVILNVAGLREILQIKIEGATTSGVRFEWPQSVEMLGPFPRSELLRNGEPILSAAQETVGFPLILRPANGKFSYGEYRITYSTPGFRDLLMSDGRPWTGEAMGEGWREIRLIVRQPEGVTETAMMFREDSRAALRRGDDAGALLAQRKAMQSDPTNRDHEYHLALLLVKLNRDREAIPLLESLDAVTPTANIIEHLARAYLKVGNEGRARATLRRLGRSDVNTEKLLETFREEKRLSQ